MKIKPSVLLTYRKHVSWVLIILGVITGLVKNDISNLTVYKAIDSYWPFFLVALGMYLLWNPPKKT